MFDSLIGNQQIKEMFVRMLRANRIPGGMLFTGEAGLGKKLFALELARAANCQSLIDNQGCGKCARCRRIVKFAEQDQDESVNWSEFPDVGFIRPSGAFIKVLQIRSLEREANFRPFEGSKRFLIVDEADRMNESAANALLKTLEEPPPTTHLILISSRPAKLAPTILSRCQIIRFSPLTADEIARYLVKEKQYSQPDANLVSRISVGSLGRALSIDLEKYREQRYEMLDLLTALTVEKDRAKLLRGSEHLNEAKLKEEYEERLDLLASLIHDAWMIALGNDPSSAANSDLGIKLTRAAESGSSKVFARWLTSIDEHKRRFIFNINKKVSTDALLLEMAAAS